MSLGEILEALQVPRQSLLYVHSSMDWLGRIGLRLPDILQGLCEYVLPGGTLVMPGYPFRGPQLDYVKAGPEYDVCKTPARLGLIPEMFRRLPGVLRSLDPDYPILALGKEAAELTEGFPPVDPFGGDSVYRRLLDRQATLVGLGVSLNTNTFVHVLDSMLAREYPFPIHVDEPYAIVCRGRNGEKWTQPRRVLRPTFQTKSEPGTLVAEIGQRENCFAKLELQGTICFRWHLGRWETFSLEHARRQLSLGQPPSWLRKAVA